MSNMGIQSSSHRDPVVSRSSEIQVNFGGSSGHSEDAPHSDIHGDVSNHKEEKENANSVLLKQDTLSHVLTLDQADETSIGAGAQ